MTHRKDIHTAVSASIQNLENKEFVSIVESFDFFSFKFPDLIKEFPKEFEKFKNGGNEWKAFLREIKFWNEVGVEEMNRRLLQLCQRYIPKGEQFFRFENEIGTFTLPTRLDRLNKISLLAKEFVYDVFPRIESNLNFRVGMSSVVSNTIRGKINWPNTITQSINRGEKFPTAFSCDENETNFDTSENILAMTCLMKLQKDIDYLLYSKSTKFIELNYKETNLLKNLKSQIDGMIFQTPMRNFIPKIEQFVALSLSSKPVRNLEDKTLQRIKQGIVRQKSYQDLIEWLQKYRNYYIKGITKEFTNYPIEHEKTIDIIFELWIIFEMVTYFIEKKNIRLLKPLTSEGNKFAGFKLQLENNVFYLQYQGIHRGWTGYKSEPDFTIRLEGSDKIPIVMDPKNWSADSQTGEAIHKMLGYLMNLSKFDARIGILFFSRPPASHKKEGESNLPYVVSTQNVLEQEISFYTMYVNSNNPVNLVTNFEVIYTLLQKICSNFTFNSIS